MRTTPRATTIHQTITLLAQEVEALAQRRGELLRVIDSLRPLAGDDTSRRRRKKKALKRNERTNERAKRAPTARRPRSLPDDVGEAIVAQLKAHGGSMKPGALAKALKIPKHVLRYQLKHVVRAGRVTVTGATLNRQVALPRSRAAKEAP